MSAHEQGFAHAWDTGGAPYERAVNLYEPGSNEWQQFYAGYRDGCKDVADYRKGQGIREEEKSPTEQQENLNL